MKGTYKRELNASYFILEEQAMESSQYYQMKMVIENKIRYLLPLSIHNFNGENQFYYDISGKQTLACMFEKKEIVAEQLIQILKDLSKILLELEGYLLDESYLCLNPEYMYMNVTTQELFLCFYPFEQKDISQSIQDFSEYLLNCINHQDERAVNIGYQLYRLTREENFAFIQVVEEILREYEREEENHYEKNNYKENNCEEDNDAQKEYSYLEIELREEQDKDKDKVCDFKIPITCFLLFMLAGMGYILYQYVNRPIGEVFLVSDFFATRDMILAAGSIFVGLAGILLLFVYSKILKGGKVGEREEAIQQMEREYYAKNQLAYEQKEQLYEDIEEEENEPYTQYEETVLLKENLYSEEGILIEKQRKRDKKAPIKIVLDQFPFVIGKLEESVDFVILDKSISRIHAKFIKNPNEDMIYLMDLNSKNGTYKNGIPLEVNEMVSLTAEDEITFGNVTFTYH